MALNRIQAARLLTDKEMVLFESSLADHSGQLGDKELTARIRQLRTQRDKYQDLFRRQRVATRERTGSKAGPRAVSNERTRIKADAFAQALERLEKLQQRRENASSRTKTKSPGLLEAVKAASADKAARAGNGKVSDGPTRSVKAPANTPASAGRGPTTPAAPGIANRKRTQSMGQARTLAHVSSRGRRDQARRDAR